MTSLEDLGMGIHRASDGRYLIVGFSLSAEQLGFENKAGLSERVIVDVTPNMLELMYKDYQAHRVPVKPSEPAKPVVFASEPASQEQEYRDEHGMGRP